MPQHGQSRPRPSFSPENSGPVAWVLPADKVERAVGLHRAGKSANFIYQALWPESPPVTAPTFNRALAALLAELERAKLLAKIAYLENGDVNGAVGLALKGSGSLPPEIERVRTSMLGVFDRLQRRFDKEMDAECAVKDATTLSKGMCETATIVLKIEKFRLEAAILSANLEVQKQEVDALRPPEALGPPVQIDMTEN